VRTLDTIYTNCSKIQILALQLIKTEKEAYSIQSYPRQSSSSSYSFYLDAEGNRTEEGQMTWRRKPY